MGAGVASRWISGGRPGRGGFGVDVVSVAERRPPCGCELFPPRIAGTRAIGVRGSTDGTTESARTVAFWGRMAPRVGQHFGAGAKWTGRDIAGGAREAGTRGAIVR